MKPPFATSDYRSILDELYDGMYVVDRKRVIQYWNKAAEHITGYSAEEVLGKSCSQNILTHVDGKGCNLCQGRCPLTQTMQTGQNQEAQVFLHHKNGHRVPVSVRVSSLRSEEGEVIGGVELFRPSSHQDVLEERIRELESMALIDPLTRTANRHYIEQDLASRIDEFRRMMIPFGILFIDVDSFKNVNDTYGHDIGDKVLKFVAATLTQNLRTFDLVGRWGGEEFLCILRNVHEETLHNTAERIRMLVEQAYLIEAEQKLQVTISVGATQFRKNDTPETVLKRADDLLYQSKKAGRNRIATG